MKPNDIIGFAREFATLCHAECGQTYDGKPYSYHLKSVVGVLMDFGEYDKTVLAAGWLHDVVEDCDVSIPTIENLFGPKVSTLVGALTDEPGENRKERKAKTYPKIRATPGAVTLKLADRIANIKNGIETQNRRMFLMYKKEHAEFEAALRPDSSAVEQAMWKHLDYLFGMGDRMFSRDRIEVGVNV